MVGRIDSSESYTRLQYLGGKGTFRKAHCAPNAYKEERDAQLGGSMVGKLVHVDLQGAFVTPEPAEQDRPDLVHVLGRQAAEHTVWPVRRRQLE